MREMLGSLTAASLGTRISGEGVRTHGTPNAGYISGTVESVHHFRVGDEDWSSCIVRIVRTREQVQKKEADCREIRGPSATKVEVG